MDEQFPGFEEPNSNYSKLPNVLIDALPLIETIGEFKVITYILRHTWGYRQDERRITLDEFANGRWRDKQNNERLDQGTGLSIPTIRDGLKRAIEHGFIIHEQDASDKARVKNVYSLKMCGSEKDLHSGCKEPSAREQEAIPRTKKESLERKEGKEIKKETDELQKFGIGEHPPTAGLPPALDGHQRAVDRASSGSDTVIESIMRHYYGGWMKTGPIGVPDKKRAKWLAATERLYDAIPKEWQAVGLKRLCLAIDQVCVYDLDDFWSKMPCKDENLDLVARAIVSRLRDGYGPSPNQAPPAPDPEADLARWWRRQLASRALKTFSHKFDATAPPWRQDGTLHLALSRELTEAGRRQLLNALDTIELPDGVRRVELDARPLGLQEAA